VAKNSPREAPPSYESSEARARAEELMRRIEELESLDDSAFGAFGAGDWLVCMLAALALPAAILLWFAP
jgi:hypothetical protein